MQLNRLNELHAEFQAAGIGVHAITAQPGGAETIRRSLTAFGLPEMKFPIYSDPSWSMMTLEPRERIYVENLSHPFLLEAGQFTHPYRMVQPALAIVDNVGEVVYWWSWNTLKPGVLGEDGVLPNQRRSEDNPDGNTHDVRWRPVPDDILEKLTKGGNLQNLRVDNLGFPSGKDHVNVKKMLFANPADKARIQLQKQRETGEAPKIFKQHSETAKSAL